MKVRVLGVVFFMLPIAVTPALAHHSFVQEYDAKKPVTIKGAISELIWANPHSFIKVAVKDEAGKVVIWMCEGFPPNTLHRQGVMRDMVKVGTEITLTGWLAKDGSNQMAGREITYSDGRKVFWGPTAD